MDENDEYLEVEKESKESCLRCRCYQFRIQKYGIYFPRNCDPQKKLKHHQSIQGFSFINKADFEFYEQQWKEHATVSFLPRPSSHQEEFNLDYFMNPETWVDLELSQTDVLSVLEQATAKSCWRLGYLFQWFQTNTAASIEKPWNYHSASVSVKSTSSILATLKERILVSPYFEQLKTANPKMICENDQHVPKAPVYTVDAAFAQQLLRLFPSIGSSYENVLEWRGALWVPQGFYKPPSLKPSSSFTLAEFSKQEQELPQQKKRKTVFQAPVEMYLSLVTVLPKEEYLQRYGYPTSILNQPRVYRVNNKEYCDHWGVCLLQDVEGILLNALFRKELVEFFYTDPLAFVDPSKKDIKEEVEEVIESEVDESDSVKEKVKEEI